MRKWIHYQLINVFCSIEVFQSMVKWRKIRCSVWVETVRGLFLLDGAIKEGGEPSGQHGEQRRWDLPEQGPGDRQDLFISVAFREWSVPKTPVPCRNLLEMPESQALPTESVALGMRHSFLDCKKTWRGLACSHRFYQSPQVWDANLKVNILRGTWSAEALRRGCWV